MSDNIVNDDENNNDDPERVHRRMPEPLSNWKDENLHPWPKTFNNYVARLIADNFGLTFEQRAHIVTMLNHHYPDIDELRTALAAEQATVVALRELDAKHCYEARERIDLERDRATAAEGERDIINDAYFSMNKTKSDIEFQLAASRAQVDALRVVLKLSLKEIFRLVHYAVRGGGMMRVWHKESRAFTFEVTKTARAALAAAPAETAIRCRTCGNLGHDAFHLRECYLEMMDNPTPESVTKEGEG